MILPIVIYVLKKKNGSVDERRDDDVSSLITLQVVQKNMMARNFFCQQSKFRESNFIQFDKGQ